MNEIPIRKPVNEPGPTASAIYPIPGFDGARGKKELNGLAYMFRMRIAHVAGNAQQASVLVGQPDAQFPR